MEENPVTEQQGQVTRLLGAIRSGARDAVEELLPLVYDELRRLAGSYLQAERPDHTLQPTALVHEVFLKLVNQRTAGWEDRAHFLGVAAQAMRRILVDHARSARAGKRGGDAQRVPLDEMVACWEERAQDLTMLDDALARLARQDPIKAHIVELRFFGGLTMAETAEVLGLPQRSVERHWTFARAWLWQRVSGERGDAT